MFEPANIPKSLDDLPNSKPRHIGQMVNRVEDRDHVMGRTEYIDNIDLPGMLHCAILRSTYPHARIKKIDISAALALPGVTAVVTGDDAARWTQPNPNYYGGSGRYSLAVDKVRYVGEPVAAVAAVNRYVAEDAIELIRVEYEPLPPVTDCLAALDPENARVFENAGTNVMFHKLYTWGEVDQAFATADHVFTEKFRWHRVGGNPMENAGFIAQWDPVDLNVIMQGTVQIPGMYSLSRIQPLGLPPGKMRTISTPRGGSFGSKSVSFGADIIVLLLSRKADGRPVKWIEDRMESLLAGGNQAWDRFYEASIAVAKDGTFTGFRVKLFEDVGASGEVPTLMSGVKPLACFTGCYAIPVAQYDLTLVATNKTPTTFYRGAGPPPHNCVLEQMVDIAARALGMDPAALRRKNYIPAESFPYTIASGNEYDSGNYGAALDRVLEMANYDELRREQAAARGAGRYLGIGVANAIEPGVGDSVAYHTLGNMAVGQPEGVTVSLDLLGHVTVRIGFTSEGQAHHTLAKQVAADYFCIDMESVLVLSLDSQAAPPSFGPGGSRASVAITAAILGACALLKEKLAKVAAVLLQVAPENVELQDGMLRIKGMPDARISVTDVVGALIWRSDLLPSDMDPNPSATYCWTGPGCLPADEQGRAKGYVTSSSACHIALVEVFPQNGSVKVLKYWCVDDCGTRLNPVSLDGMLDGGIAQGIGATLFEEFMYSDEGQPLTTTLMDYLLPTMHEVPANEKASQVTPSPVGPLGAKGAGEGAMHATPAVIMCAINDALMPLGLRATEVPASPLRLWRLLQGHNQIPAW